MLLQFLAVILYFQNAESRNICSSSKWLPRYIEAFANIQNEDMLWEAKFISKSEAGYRFEIIQPWSENDGGLDSIGKIVTITDSKMETSITMCLDELSVKESYLLLLRLSEGSFFLQIAPFSLKKNIRRDEIRQAWCDLPKSNCALKISRYHLEPLFELYSGANTILKCKIDSKSDLIDIRWLKDGKDIETVGGEVYAKYGIFVYKKDLHLRSSELVLFNANSMHSGLFTCVASNSDGENTKLSSRVVMDSESTAFGECPSWAVSYCHETSVCMSILDLPHEVKCECSPGHSGRRCQETVPEMRTDATVKENAEMNEKVHRLKATIVVLAIALGVSISMLVYLIVRNVRRNPKRNPNPESV